MTGYFQKSRDNTISIVHRAMARSISEMIPTDLIKKPRKRSLQHSELLSITAFLKIMNPELIRSRTNWAFRHNGEAPWRCHRNGNRRDLQTFRIQEPEYPWPGQQFLFTSDEPYGGCRRAGRHLLFSQHPQSLRFPNRSNENAILWFILYHPVFSPASRLGALRARKIQPSYQRVTE